LRGRGSELIGGQASGVSAFQRHDPRILSEFPG
jgi:hypothetical protein